MAVPRLPSSSRRPAQPPPGLEPDEIIGDFHRGREIGKGSFATVYLAQHRKKKSFAAVKAVQMAKLSKKLKENLATEIEILKNLRHPHIVQLFVCSNSPAYIYLVMEYCQLSDLAQFMKKRHFLPNLPETADIFRKYPNPEHGGLNEVLSRHFLKQIASALQYLRAGNLIHRDIKPQNLLLNPSPTYMSQQKPEDVPLAASENSLIPAVGVASLPMLKIADFGFARHLPSTSMAETLCGSPLYMAPEILRYEKYDARADLWSTGTVLHEMVVGKPPFRAQNHVDLLRKIEKANDVITFDNRTMTISRGMKDLIRKLLKKNPIERMTYEDLFEDAVVTGEIPSLASEDRPQEKPQPVILPDAEGVPRVRSIRSRDLVAASGPAPVAEEQIQPKRSLDEGAGRRSSSEQDSTQRRSGEAVRRKSSVSSPNQLDAGVRRQTSQREQRRPSIVAHITAPGRQELHQYQPLIPQPPRTQPQSQQKHPAPAAAPRIERRSSRSSPLSGPPLIREPTLESEKSNEDRNNRIAREQTAQDLTFEKEYVVIEKRFVEVNALADDIDANAHMLHGNNTNARHGTMIRRATTASAGQPTSLPGAQAPSPSRAMQPVGVGSAPIHQKIGSFERRNGPYSQTPTNMLANVLSEANKRFFGASGSPPPSSALTYNKGPSPPSGYNAFPLYPTPGLYIGDGNETKLPMDEDSRLARIMEDAAHRSDVIFGFAEVKYRQLLPATPSAQDALGIQHLGSAVKGNDDDDSEQDKNMTTFAIVSVAEEALVLYVKALAILTKTVDLAGYWWQRINRSEGMANDTALGASPLPNSNSGSRILAVVKWTRTRFNECLEKSELVGRRLQAAQRQLPEDHPGNPNNHAHLSGSGGTGTAISTSAEQIRITSGITAERLMYERAVEMSRAAAVNELVGEGLHDCDLNYQTAIMLFEAVLESDDEPLVRKPSQKKDRPADEVITGMETEDRQTVLKLIEGAKARLHALRKKVHAAQQQQQQQSHQRKRSSMNSGNSSAKHVSAGAT